jgi:hypothetical protein
MENGLWIKTSSEEIKIMIERDKKIANYFQSTGHSPK